MTARIGEYFNAGYIKHPAPSNWLANGEGLDAGSMMIVDSNISWLAKESPRHLVTTIGPTATLFSSNTDVYESISNFASPPSSLTLTPHRQIPWDRRTAVKFGPFPMVQDEQNTHGLPIPRKVNFAVKSTYSSVTLTMYFALTTSSSAAAIFDRGEYLAFETKAASASGSVTTSNLVPPDPARGPRSPWNCRRNTATSDTGINQVNVRELWAWVGFRPVDGGGGSCTINSISIWETR